MTEPAPDSAPPLLRPVPVGGALIAGGATILTTSAALAAQAGLAAQFYQSQAFLAAVSIRDIITIWQQLNLRDVRSSWPALRTALASLIRDRFGQSAVLGTDFYRRSRLAAGVLGDTPVATPEAPAAALVDATLDSTGPWSLLGRIKTGQPLMTATENTGVQMSGAAQRLISNGARQAVMQSVEKDAKAVAWMRVTSANPCAFCSMLAGRGASYVSEKSASFEAHNLCQCVAAPVFSREVAEATKDNPMYQQWKQATRGHSGADALKAWRAHWDSQQGRDGVRVLPAA